MSFWIPAFIATIVFELVNILVHSLGLYLLVRTFYGKKNPVQTIYLINLSAAIILKNTLLLSRDVCMLLFIARRAPRDVIKVVLCINAFLASGTFYNYILGMFYITVDRYLHVALSIRYPIFCPLYRTKVLVACTWFSTLVASTIVTVVYSYVSRDVLISYHVDLYLNVYIPSTLYAAFVTCAIFTYLSMFFTFVDSYRNTRARKDTTATTTTTDLQTASFLDLFLNSRFYVSFCIVLCYTVLMVAPSLTRSGLLLSRDNVIYNPVFNLYLLISSLTSDLFDAMIYIFLQKKVRLCFSKLIGWSGIKRQMSSRRTLTSTLSNASRRLVVVVD